MLVRSTEYFGIVRVMVGADPAGICQKFVAAPFQRPALYFNLSAPGRDVGFDVQYRPIKIAYSILSISD
jgi:hypothetical protein